MDKLLFIAELIWLTMICEVSSANLTCPTRDGNKKVDCAFIFGSNRPRQNIAGEGPPLPKKVSPGVVEYLDISGNNFETANCNDLTRLVQFNAKNVSLEASGSIGSFKTCLSKLKALEELDLTGTVHLGPEFGGLVWPKKLTKLTLVKMKLERIGGLDTLDQLQELDLSSNSLTSFPKLNRSAPIILIHLRGNAIRNITVEDVALYCEMVSFSVPESMNEPSNYNNCAPLQEWVKKFSIDTFETLSCKVPSGGGNVTKNLTFSEEALHARNACLSALPRTDIWDILLFAVFFSILFPLLYYGNEAYNKYQAKKLETQSSAPVKRRRRRTTTTAPQGSDYEGSQSEGGSLYGEREEG